MCCVYENLWEPWLKFYFYSISSLSLTSWVFTVCSHALLGIHLCCGFYNVYTVCTHLFYNKKQKTQNLFSVFLSRFLWLFWALIALNDECVNFRCAWAFPFRQKIIRNWMKWNGLCMCASHRAGYLFEHIKKNLISK